MKIAITGASGFLGRHITRAALEAGHSVIALVRRPEEFDPRLTRDGACRARTFDLGRIPEDLEACLEGTDALIHAAGLIRGTPGDILHANLEGTRALLAAVKGLLDSMRFVFISSMAIFEAHAGDYGRSKEEAEVLVRQRASEYAIIRPTLIYGREDSGWTRRIRSRVTEKTFLLLPGGGRARIQPLYVEDAARAVIEAAVRKEGAGQTFDIGGPDLIEQGAFLALARKALKGRTVFVPLPLWPLRLAGKLLGSKFAAAAAYCGTDHPVDNSLARDLLHYTPRPVEEGLKLTFS